MTEVKVKFIDGMQFLGISPSGHSIIMDTDKEKGGENASVRPMELLLLSLAGCTGMDVIYILRKMRVEPKKFEIIVKAERKEEHPRVYKKVLIEYIFYGDIPENKVKEAIELSFNKYCAVTATLKAVGEVHYSLTIKKEGV